MTTSDFSNNFETSISKYVVRPTSGYVLEDDGFSSRQKGDDEKRYFLDSRDNFRYYWDLMIVVLLFYVSSVSVYIIAFIGSLETSSGFFWIERILDVIFFIDIVLNFFTLYYANQSEYKELMKLSNKEIQKRIILKYLSTYFIFDLLSVIPWDMIAQYNDSEKNNIIEIFKYLRLLRLLKLFRLARIIRINHSFMKIENFIRVKYAYIRVVVLFVSLMFIAHWVACIFYFFGTSARSLGEPFYASWVKGDRVPVDQYSRYLLSLYFSVYTITTIGYGDIVPGNTFERTYVTIIMFFGAICFAWAIGQIANITSEIKQSSIKYRQQMDNLLDYCYVNKIDDGLSQKLRVHVQEYYSNRRSNEKEELFEILPNELKLDISKRLYSKYVEGAFQSLFHNSDGHQHHNLDTIYLSIQEQSFIKNQYLYLHGDSSDYLYILKSGEVAIMDRNGIDYDRQQGRMETASTGYMVGLHEIAFKKSRQSTVLVKEKSEVLVIPAKAVLECLKSSPREWRKFLTESSEFMDNLDESIDNSSDMPSIDSMGKEALKEEIVKKSKTITELQKKFADLKTQLDDIMISFKE